MSSPAHVDSFSLIKPNHSESKALDKDQKELVFDLPESFRARNLLIEIRGRDRVQAKAGYSNGLKVQLIES